MRYRRVKRAIDVVYPLPWSLSADRKGDDGE